MGTPTSTEQATDLIRCSDFRSKSPVFSTLRAFQQVADRLQAVEFNGCLPKVQLSFFVALKEISLF